jgi:hypothetical protein
MSKGMSKDMRYKDMSKSNDIRIRVSKNMRYKDLSISKDIRI